LRPKKKEKEDAIEKLPCGAHSPKKKKKKKEKKEKKGRGGGRGGGKKKKRSLALPAAVGPSYLRFLLLKRKEKKEKRERKREGTGRKRCGPATCARAPFAAANPSLPLLHGEEKKGKKQNLLFITSSRDRPGFAVRARPSGFCSPSPPGKKKKKKKKKKKEGGNIGGPRAMCPLCHL